MDDNRSSKLTLDISFLSWIMNSNSCLKHFASGLFRLEYFLDALYISHIINYILYQVAIVLDALNGTNKA